MQKQSRRSFVKTTAAASAGFMVLPGFTRISPNNKLNLAFIGVGGRGGANLRRCAAGNQVVALCDVSEKRAAKGYQAFPKAKRFSDFREMFDKMANEIDAVVISTPDHTHFAATMAAMQLGKHVYVEKPLAHNVWQLRTLKKAAKHYQIISQLGNQGHTTDGIRKVKEWYDAGLLGEVKEVIAWFNGPHFSETGYFSKPTQYPAAEEPIPAGFNWDAWLGPAKDRPYSHYYAPKTWRGWYEFGNGELGDWACHTLDAPFWTLDLGMPTSASSLFRLPKPNGDHFVSDHSHIQFNFPARGDKAAVTMNWFEGGLKPANRPEWHLDKLPNSGMIMVGEKRSLATGGRPNQPQILGAPAELEALTLPDPSIPRVAEENPQIEWVNAIKGEGPMPGSSFEYGADLTEMALIGVLAQRFDTHIEYDAANMKITNHPDFEQYIKEPVRTGWAYGEELWR